MCKGVFFINLKEALKKSTFVKKRSIMQNNCLKKVGLIFILFITIIGCSKEGFLDYSDLEHNADWLLPFVQTKVTAEQVAKLNDLSYDIGALPLDAPFLNTGLPIPPVSLEVVGPIELKDTDSIYVKFKSDTATLKVYITNNFPINIKAGTKVEIRNSFLNNLVVFDGLIQNDIPAKGGKDSVIVTRVITTPWVDNELELFLVDFSSDGTGGIVEDFNVYNNIDIKLKIEVIHLNEVEIYGNINYLVTDTSKFEFGSYPKEPDDESIEKATIHLFVENGVPLTYSVKGYFLDANYSIIDSLFGNTTVSSPGIDALGYVINSTIVEEKISTELTKYEYNEIRNRTKHMYYQFKFTSQSQNIRAIHSNYVKLHVTADITTKVSL